ncbi:MAG: sugar phosphate isomerase/epimerase [Theionarchaea archaeon]|nr:sugar phosphate isomerase/epimerase [Theionarchaea archaeon]
MFKEINISTWAFEEVSASESLPVLKELGFGSVEVWGVTNSHFDPQNPSSVARLGEDLSSTGIRADSLHAPFGGGVLDISNTDPVQRGSAVKTLSACLEAASNLGAWAMIIHPGHLMGPGEEPTRYRLAVESLETLCGRGDDLGVTVCVENLFSDDFHLVFCDTLPKVLHLVRSVEGPAPAICIDTSHANIMGGVPDEIEICGSAIRRTHISDNMGEHDDHLPPGDGVIDWEGVVTSLRRISFPGPLTLEIAGRQDPGGNVGRARASMEDLLASGDS